MAQPRPNASRKTSARWDRLRPVKQDPLEAMGFVSKGDIRLLDPKLQETFYQKIVARYMDFCARNSTDLDPAFTSLSNTDSSTVRPHPTQITTSRPSDLRPIPTEAFAVSNLGSPAILAAADMSSPTSNSELSNILTALRKLREGLLGSSTTAPSPVFSQRVHVFNIRLAILALHPSSYQASLSYLLSVLHTPAHPLPQSELTEMTTYAILDRALRQNDLIAAYNLRFESRQKFGYESRDVDSLLRAVVSNNWVEFWRIRRKVDGYVRAIIYWHINSVRKTTLKAFGRAYLRTDLDWLLRSASGSEMNWNQLVETEQVGWHRDAENIMIRKPKAR